MRLVRNKDVYPVEIREKMVLAFQQIAYIAL